MAAHLIDKNEILESAQVDESEYNKDSISFEVNLQVRNIRRGTLYHCIIVDAVKN